MTEKKESAKEQKKESYFNYLKIGFFTLGIILLIFVIIWAFTFNPFFKGIDYSKTGPIGDTIGGLTAPFIGLIGAVLVYLSFKAQITANKKQFDTLNDEINARELERNFEINMDLFKQIKEDYSKLYFGEFYGKIGVDNYSELYKQYSVTDKTFELAKHAGISIFEEFFFVLNETYLLLYRLKQSKLESDEKKQLYLLIGSFYKIKLKYPCEKYKAAFLNKKEHSEKLLLINDIMNIVNQISTEV